jgi:hypothetical protein
MSRKQAVIALVAGAMSLSLAGYASAQDNSGAGNNPAGQNQDRNSRRTFDPAQWRQQMSDRMKEMLGSSDDEWKVIQPRLEKVMQLQRETRGGGMGFMFGRNRDRGQSSSSQSDSAVAKAAADLRSALEDKSISADEIAKRLANYRQAKEQAKQELVKAQSDLKELLSQRQEAQLVMMGMLD